MEEQRRTFVSIASYRDPELIPTVIDCYTKAKNPQLLHMAVCQQIVEKEDVLLDLRKHYYLQENCKLLSKENILIENRILNHEFKAEISEYIFNNHQTCKLSILTFDATFAHGPMFARGLIEKCLYLNDCWFYLIIDSHMCFMKNFDELLIDQYCKASQLTLQGFQKIQKDELPKVVLSTYPMDYEPNVKINQRGPSQKSLSSNGTYLRFLKFHTPVQLSGSKATATTSNPLNIKRQEMTNVFGLSIKNDKNLPVDSPYFTSGKPRVSSDSVVKKSTLFGVPQQDRMIYSSRAPSPVPSVLWAACFSFAPASMLTLTPYDPYCFFVFMGEEFSMAARLHSHGFQIFSPSVHIVFHLTVRTNRNTFWELLKSSDGKKTNSTTTSSQSNDAKKTIIPVFIRRGTQVVRQVNASETQNTTRISVSKETQMKRKLFEKYGYQRLQSLLWRGEVTCVKDTKATSQVPSNSTVLVLDHEDAMDSSYGLGPKMSIEDFEAFSGIRVSLQQIERRARYGFTPAYEKNSEKFVKHYNAKDLEKKTWHT